MVASAIFLLDQKGKVLISRNYRGDIPMTCIERFPKLLADQEEDNTITPIIQDDNVTFVYIKHSNVYVVSVTNRNSNTIFWGGGKYAQSRLNPFLCHKNGLSQFFPNPSPHDDSNLHALAL